MVTPDGMASMAQERQHMREMRQLDSHPSPPWELAALDADGNELYRTESFESREEAQADADAFADGSAYWADNIDDEVDRFEPRKKE